MGNNNDDDENDESLLDELRNTKNDLFGADIPSNDELQNAAQDAENAFLAAMLEQTQQFRRIKSEKGSDGAVEVFMERIQEEDEAGRMLEGKVAGDGGGARAGGEESIDRKWFVQQMQDENDENEEKRLDEGNNNDDRNDNAWQ